METVDVIDKAITLIERDGWVQEQSHTLDGRRCLAYALEFAGDEADEFYGPAWRKVAAAIGILPEGLTRWNDAVGRTKEEVLDILQKAKAIEEMELKVTT